MDSFTVGPTPKTDFTWHQFRLNPILEQRVMIKTLRRAHKSSLKPEMCPDGCCFPIRVWTWNPISTQTLNGVRTVLPRCPDGCTWTLDSSRTLNSGQTICHYVRTDAILNNSKFLDTDGRPDGKFSSSWRMLLIDECPDGNTTSSGRFLGIRLLWVGICTESSFNTKIAFMKLVTLATCHNTALSASEK
jgi:hypothetical protein